MPATRVLLVDDEDDFLRLLTTRLRRRRLDVLCATTAEAAFDVLAEQAVDVVVLDIRLPGMDGLDAVGRIKGDHPAARIIMLTGFADKEMARQAMQRGASAYLVKPVDVATLVDCIHRTVDDDGDHPCEES